MLNPSSSRPSSRPTLGLLVDWLRDFYQNALFASIDDAARERDVNLLCVAGGVLNSPQLRWSQRNVLYELVGSHNLDGLIVTAGTMGNLIGPDKLSTYLERYKPLPVISTAYQLPGLPSVVMDNANGARGVLEHLIVAHGYRRIAYIRGAGGNAEATQRFEVYRDVLAEHGIAYEPSLVYEGTFHRESGEDAARYFLERGIDFPALAAANDLMALGALEVFSAAGVNVPNDLALVGFDDGDAARFSTVPLTTVRQPLREFGREAVRLALARIAGPTEEVVSLHPELVIRSSCGCRHGRGSGNVDTSPTVDTEQRFNDCFAPLKRAGSPASVALSSQLFDQLSAELAGDPAADFTGAFMAHVPLVDDVHLDRWRRVGSAVLTFLRDCAPSPEEKSWAIESRLNAELGSRAEVVQGIARMQLRKQARALSETARVLSTTFDHDGIIGVLQERLPRLGFPASFLSLYENAEQPHDGARLRLWHPQLESPADTQDIQPIVPASRLWGLSRRTWVLEPLFFEHTQLGLLGLEVGPQDGPVYEALRDQVSGALKGALLMVQAAAEAEQRRRAEREQADEEARIAAHIQTMILPVQPEVAGLEIAAKMLPALHVGGDYYDVLPTADGCWLGIGDVAGHGLASGLVMLMIQSSVLALVTSRPNMSPTEVVRAINGVVHENVKRRLEQNEHATFCVGRYRTDGNITFAGGHDDALLYRAKSGVVQRVSPEGMWIGLIPELRAEDSPELTVRLEDGDVLLLYTDGLVEARDASGEQFGDVRLTTIFTTLGRHPVEEIRDRLLRAVQEWMAEQQDDVTLLVARHRARPPALAQAVSSGSSEGQAASPTHGAVDLRMDVKPVWASVRAVREAVSQLLGGFDAEIRTAAAMAASELVENLVKYGASTDPDRTSEFRLSATNGRIQLTTKNAADPAREAEVAAMLKELTEAGDRASPYLRRQQELLRSPTASGKLGLYRIASEGGFELDCQFEGGKLVVRATRRG